MACATATINMEPNAREDSTDAILTISFAVFIVIWSIWLIKKSRAKAPPLPPGPRGLPLIGNLPFLEPDLHRYFAKLAQTYGPIMKLQLGTKLCIVLSSPSMVKEVLKDQDMIFANRDIPAVAVPQRYGGGDLVWAPYGPHWRMFRKIFVKEIVSSTSLEAWYAFRRREVHRTVGNVYAKRGTPINIGDEMFATILNVITSVLWGGTLVGDQENSRLVAEFRPLVDEIGSLGLIFNVSDLFPLLARFDFQGLERRMVQLISPFDRIFNAIIEERLRMYGSGEREGSSMKSSDLLEVLLHFENEGSNETALTTNHIKALFLEIVLAGTDTTSTTVEWAMAELMEHPEMMRKVQNELERVVGLHNIVEESHLAKLQYLEAIIKETLRLHPAAPLLVPHCPSKTCIVGGYTVPKGARILVNAWAIQTNPQAWDSPLEFQPERFLNANSKWDFNGKDFHYIPFGSGRRICAGLPMAEKMTTYVLASLLHSFDWRLPEGIKFDLSDKFASLLRKATPLLVVPTPRLSNEELYA